MLDLFEEGILALMHYEEWPDFSKKEITQKLWKQIY